MLEGLSRATGGSRVCRSPDPGLDRGSCVAYKELLGVLLCACLLACGTSGAEKSGERERAERGVGPLVTRAQRLRASGDFDLAVDAYRQAYERTPWNERLKRSLAVTYTERAQAVRNEGRLPSAEEDLRRALELYPDDEEFQSNLAVVLLERAQLVGDDAASAQLLDEVRKLAPQLEIPESVVRARLERRLNLAFELLERRQLEAGIARLNEIRRDYPREPEVVRLLAQATLNLADSFVVRENYARAGELFDEAVLLYKEIEPCDGSRCTREELKTAHYNRCVLRINALEDARAREALAEARDRGFRFPELEEALTR